MNAWVEPAAGTFGFQPEMVPSSLAKRNRAAPDTPPDVTANPVPPLNTVPVGAPGTVTVSGIVLSGAAAANYVLASPTATTTANITAVSLTAAVAAANKVYDGTTATTATCTLTGLVGTDVVTCSGTAIFDTAHVGTAKTVTVNAQ